MPPSFLLAKLYMKGSLKNCDSGYKFNLKNIVAANISDIGKIKFDIKDTVSSE
jgi:hypothetical protein